MRDGEGKALTTQHTPGKSTDGEMIRRSDIDALIKALKENGGNQSDGAHENEGSASPDQQGMRNEDETEERYQFEVQSERGEEGE
ncbi:hypothetical protein IGI04_030642, partial [Brassica rapa subsp. trilocularis]